jgi:hypothetical protein
MLQAWDTGAEFHPDFNDGLKCQKVLDAVKSSSDSRLWKSI